SRAGSSSWWVWRLLSEPAAALARRGLDDHAHGVQQPVARAAYATALLERVVNVGERLGREALTGQHVRDTRRIGRKRLRRDPPNRLRCGHDLLRTEVCLARGH